MADASNVPGLPLQQAAEAAHPKKESRKMPREAVEAALELCQVALDGIATLLKSRPKTLNALLDLEKSVLNVIEIANDQFPEDLVPDVGVMLQKHVDVLLKWDGELGGGERNPARTRLLSLAASITKQLTKPPVDTYNPLEMKNLARSTALEFSEQPTHKLTELKPFEGAGVYAIYYGGGFELYKPIADANTKTEGSRAIYVGEAGRDKRKGVTSSSNDSEKTVFARLEDHRASIQVAENLKVDDFTCRYLVIEDIFIPLCESILIENHRPLWNMKVDGFGNKHVGESRMDTQQMTKWDLLHPGRPNRATVGRKDKYKTFDDVAQLVKEFFEEEAARKEKLAKGEVVPPISREELAEVPDDVANELTAEGSGAAS
jgi:hypothetical protein